MKKLTLFFTAILMVLLLASPVYATDVKLSSRCTLADAIIAANSDRAEGDCPAGRGADTIALTRDITLDSDLPKITSNITIEGNGYTISGDHRYRIFYNEGGALTIHDLAMTKGYVEGELIRDEDGTLKVMKANSIGGAIYNEGELNIINSSFSGNSADSSGGAIYNRAGTVSVSDSVFSDNWVDERGGAIYNWKEGELSIVNSSFSDNSAIWGGAIYNKDGTVSVSDSAFSDNSANDGGGAILNEEYGELSVIDSSFSGNSTWTGGAIDNYGELSVSDSSFSSNSARNSGGAIVNRSELSIVNSAFSDNSADKKGGAIYNESELSIVNSAFIGNSADEKGGAIYNWRELLSISNSSFSHNSADNGGAIANGDGTVSVSDSTFSDNSADKAGGAVYNEDELIMVNSIIAGSGRDACYSEGRLRHNINNFIQDGSCSPAFSGDPKLGELVEPEDGSPAYFPLLAGSPAIDAADDVYCPATDQIGTERPQGAGCDIGAIEYVSS